MANEVLFPQRREGFPKKSFTEASVRTTIEYVGLVEDLESQAPRESESWGDYPGLVTAADSEPLGTSGYTILTVVVEEKFTEDGPGELQEETSEVDWVDVSRSLYEHPVFAIGGGGASALTSLDIAAIEKWKQMDDVTLKSTYKYFKVGTSGETGTLTTNAKRFARGIEFGVEYWVDKVPVARKSGTYAGGPPPEGSAGQKENPSGVPNIPDGYEWVKNADRSMKSGGQTRWRRDEEWLGAIKVLVDKDQIFWSAPA